MDSPRADHYKVFIVGPQLSFPAGKGNLAYQYPRQNQSYTDDFRRRGALAQKEIG
jgi:hypothetical protein